MATVEWLRSLYHHDGAGRQALDLKTEKAAYYAAQPIWFVVATDIALVAAIAAALALLSRKAIAVWLFALSLGVIAITNGYEIASATSRTLVSRAAQVVTVIIVLIAIVELAYAWAMKRRAVLR